MIVFPSSFFPALKMENEIYSPINGYVNSINYKIGDTIEKGNIIMEIEN